jgi:hypothetical protein
MLDILPVEIQEIIFNYMSFEMGRSLNKHYQQIANNIEIKNLSPIIVTKSIVDKCLEEHPKVIMFSIINSARETATQRSVKVEGDLYVNDFCEIGTCKCENVFHISLVQIKEILKELEYNYFFLNKNLKESNRIFLTHYSFIKYAVDKHPLTKINNIYRHSKIKTTINYYYDKLLPHSFLLKTFIWGTTFELETKEFIDDSNIPIDRLYESKM